MTKLEKRIRTYISTHKKTVVMGVSAVALIYVQHLGIRSLNEFLVEEDLFEKYYNLDTEEE